ncbi:MAG TPA: low temperature requirement protein A [Solirubrobacteraceae bacterium]|nr:low temperature requirement protein A [Solirubrobacteraceae bacterium]
MARFQRDRESGEEHRATALELFYDLVFVFAITQISHLLLTHLSWSGAGQSVVIVLVVWWAWNYTTWVTNELDPESSAVVLLMIGLMLASLLMAAAIPKAFGSRALLFAGSYVAIQVGRHSFLTFAAAGPGTIERERAGRILTWFVAAGVLWIAGAAASGPARSVLWIAALGVDYGAPLVTFWVPGRKRLTGESWDVETAHFAERFQLFVIIALGESIVAIGATTSGLTLDAARLTAFVLAFAGAAGLWWLYFGAVAEIGERRLEAARDRTLAARDAYTYLHVVMVAGVIVSAVGDELVIARPTAVLTAGQVAAVVGGPVLYLGAHAVFRKRLAGSLSGRRTAGAVGCVGVGLIGTLVPGLVVGGLVAGVLMTVIAAERVMPARPSGTVARTPEH